MPDRAAKPGTVQPSRLRAARTWAPVRVMGRDRYSPEVLDHFLDADSKDGHALDRRTIVALACIKADIMHFGFGK